MFAHVDEITQFEQAKVCLSWEVTLAFSQDSCEHYLIAVFLKYVLTPTCI